MNGRDMHLLQKFNSAFAEENWNELLNLLDPKIFRSSESKELIAFPVLAKVAQILTTEDSVVPDNVKIACLKCLGNSCFNGYLYQQYVSTTIEQGTYSHNLYLVLASNDNLEEIESSSSYPFDSHFPYEGVVGWTSNVITTFRCKFDSDLSDEKFEILRLSIQFLCNLFTFACEDSNLPNQRNVSQFLYDTDLKDAIITMTSSERIAIIGASCAFVHNALKKCRKKIFSTQEKMRLCSQLLKGIQEGFESAREALMLLLSENSMMRSVYYDMTIENKLCLLQVIHNELSNSIDEFENDYIFRIDVIKLLYKRFCLRSFLIVNTDSKDLDKIQPEEIFILLDILGVVTSKPCEEYAYLRKHLLINCSGLLMSIQEIGKLSDNYFTPLQQLSDVAAAMQRSTKNDLESHPTFGFKAGLIRVIGNILYRNKECQDLFRVLNAVPALLECCNIDARNPLIMQWAILALRNFCEDNPENQEIIRNCNRVGVVESSVLQEIGVALHEDEEGKKIGIVPLPRERK